MGPEGIFEAQIEHATYASGLVHVMVRDTTGRLGPPGTDGWWPHTALTDTGRAHAMATLINRTGRLYADVRPPEPQTRIVQGILHFSTLHLPAEVVGELDDHCSGMVDHVVSPVGEMRSMDDEARWLVEVPSWQELDRQSWLHSAAEARPEPEVLDMLLYALATGCQWVLVTPDQEPYPDLSTFER